MIGVLRRCVRVHPSDVPKDARDSPGRRLSFGGALMTSGSFTMMSSSDIA